MSGVVYESLRVFAEIISDILNIGRMETVIALIIIPFSRGSPVIHTSLTINCHRLPRSNKGAEAPF